MKKGFTTKELAIAILTVGIALAIAITFYTKATANTEKKELINQANLYIKNLNADLLLAKIDDKTELYGAYIPKKANETATIKIENLESSKVKKYRGIIKVTLKDNMFTYKIAIHDGSYMLGTEKKPLEEANINEKNIDTYNASIFNK